MRPMPMVPEVLLLLLLLALGLPCLQPRQVSAGHQATTLLQQRLAEARSRVLAILSKPDWYRPFLEMLRRELHRQGLEDGEMPTLAELSSPANPEAAAVVEPPPPSPHWRRSRRSARAARPAAGAACGTAVRLSATLRVAGQLCYNATRWLPQPPQVGDDGSSADVVRVEACGAELLLSARLADAEAGEPTLPTAAATTSVAAVSVPIPASTPRAPSSNGRNASSGGRVGGYSQVRTQCRDENYCLFGGSCVYYAILDQKLCTCSPGYGGIRCEKYNLPTAMVALDEGRRSGVIGNGPVKAEEHRDILSVVESTSRLLATDDSIW